MLPSERATKGTEPLTSPCPQKGSVHHCTEKLEGSHSQALSSTTHHFTYKPLTSLVLTKTSSDHFQQGKLGQKVVWFLRNNRVNKTRWAHIFQPLFSAHLSAISQRQGDGQCLEIDSQPQFSSSGTNLPK